MACVSAGKKKKRPKEHLCPVFCPEDRKFHDLREGCPGPVLIPNRPVQPSQKALLMCVKIERQLENLRKHAEELKATRRYSKDSWMGLGFLAQEESLRTVWGVADCALMIRSS